VPVKRRRSQHRRVELVLVLMAVLGAAVVVVTSQYTISLRSPVVVRLQFPLVFAPRKEPEIAGEVRADQAGRRLTAYQQYACNKFGSACRTALAVQRAENPRGECEIYHYNTNGTLDWGYFQINTVHLQRPGVNLRDLLDCKANIDFAYQLYVERGFDAWSTYKSGAYLQHLRKF
jgi:hypothetical protein